MENSLSRSALIYGEEYIGKISNANVIVFGLGGVGGYAVESLVRAGIGNLTIVDNDKISVTNLNRQLISLTSNIGKLKVDEWKTRILDINPNIKLIAKNMFLTADNLEEFDLKQFDYILDAIDTVSSKIALIKYAKENNIPIISSLGAGNRTNPNLIKIGDLKETSYDPLAKVIRHELRKDNITHLDVIYSTEIPLKVIVGNDNQSKRSPGSTSFIPAIFGEMMAGYVINKLVK